MKHSFSDFEQGIERVSRRLPGMPKEKVLLNRLFFHAFREVHDHYNRFLARHGLNSTNFLALIMIFHSEDNKLNPCALSDCLLSSRTNVTRLADELVQAGWVERQASTEDRRRIELSLTPAGQALMENLLPRIWEHITLQWAQFSAEEMHCFKGLLHKLLANLDDMEEH
jgi:MarR family transcriptional repressor of emrRAB